MKSISFLLLAGSLLLAAASGCSRSPAKPPEALTLYALNPMKGNHSDSPRKGYLHGYRILGASEITEPQRRAELMSALQRSIDESTGETAKCFNPRHGLHLTDDGAIREYVICFECGFMFVYGKDPTRLVTISDSAAPLFNRFLKEEGLTVSK